MVDAAGVSAEQVTQSHNRFCCLADTGGPALAGSGSLCESPPLHSLGAAPRGAGEAGHSPLSLLPG